MLRSLSLIFISFKEIAFDTKANNLSCKATEGPNGSKRKTWTRLQRVPLYKNLKHEEKDGLRDCNLGINEFLSPLKAFCHLLEVDTINSRNESDQAILLPFLPLGLENPYVDTDNFGCPADRVNSTLIWWTLVMSNIPSMCPSGHKRHNRLWENPKIYENLLILYFWCLQNHF